MPAFQAMVLDGRATLVALAILAAEVLFLAAFQRGSNLAATIANGASGMALIMALRAALVGPDPLAVAIWLGVGFLAHLADLAQRLRR